MGRTPRQTEEDIKDAWFGTPKSWKRKRRVQPYGPGMATKHFQEAEDAMQEWVDDELMAVRVSGEIGDLTYDATIPYFPDGTVQEGDEIDPLEHMEEGLPEEE